MGEGIAGAPCGFKVIKSQHEISLELETDWEIECLKYRWIDMWLIINLFDDSINVHERTFGEFQ